MGSTPTAATISMTHLQFESQVVELAVFMLNGAHEITKAGKPGCQPLRRVHGVDMLRSWTTRFSGANVPKED